MNRSADLPSAEVVAAARPLVADPLNYELFDEFRSKVGEAGLWPGLEWDELVPFLIVAYADHIDALTARLEAAESNRQAKDGQ